MSIKSVLCVFAGTEKELGALSTAFALAEAYSSRLSILHISPNPSNYVGIYGEGVIESSYVIAAIEKEISAHLEHAKQHINSLSSKYNIPVLEKNNMVISNKNKRSNCASAELITLTGDIKDIVAQQGRIHDIIVISRGSNDPSAVYDSAIISALFETARPVLITPIHKDVEIKARKWQCKNISIAWDGGIEAARGMYNAMDFLEKSDSVKLLTIRDSKTNYDLKAEEDIIEYLNCHNINATGIIVTAGNRTPAEALLIRAKELDSDLMVMGAYGHSRLREMILGGITDYVLENAEIPLLLSH